MATVFDVAQYILEQQGRMTTVKLQKLVYYCQAWALVWTDKPLFGEQIQAWANGPVVPDLYYRHQGMFEIDSNNSLKGNAQNLTADEKDVINNVLKGYGNKSSQYLVELSHLEDPWKMARGNTPAGQRSTAEISIASIHEYYSGLL